MGSRCLPPLVRVGAAHTPAKNVPTRQADLGHIPLLMETQCIGLWDRIPSQKPLSNPACSSAGAWVSCLLGTGLHLPVLPRLGRGKPAFPVPPSWRSSGGSQEQLRSPTAGAVARTTHSEIPPGCRGNKNWRQQGERHGSAAGAVPGVQARRRACSLSPAYHLRMLVAGLR